MEEQHTKQQGKSHITLKKNFGRRHIGTRFPKETSQFIHFNRYSDYLVYQQSLRKPTRINRNRQTEKRADRHKIRCSNGFI